MKKLSIILFAILFFSTNVFSATSTLEKIDKVLILKSERKIYLKSKDKIIKEYDISLGFSPIGHKVKEGDGKTPEGIYKISGRNPKSAYHLSLRISYPNEKDKNTAKKLGLSPGGDIMIHGLPNSMPSIGKAHLLSDWTLGCIAVTNDEIKEIWDMVSDGTTVEIKP